MVKPTEREINQKQRLLDGLWQLYNEGQLSDVTLVVNNHEFPCNRNVLAASSHYFRAMFTSNVQETYQQKITLHDVSSDAVEALLKFMYTGLIDIEPEHAQDIFMASNLFELLDIVDCCVEYMEGQLHISNCIEMYNFAKFHACEKLQFACKSFILQNFPEVAKLKEFLEIETETIEDFLESDDINVKTEDFIFKVMENWVRHKIEIRKTMFPRLFLKLRLPIVTQDFLHGEILNNRLVLDNPFCLSVIESFLQTNSRIANETAEGHSFSENQTKQRSGMFYKDLIVFSGGSFGENERSFTAFDPVSMKNFYGLKHHPTFDLKYRIDFYQLVTLHDSDVYFVGGIFHDKYRFSENGKAMRNFLRYDSRLSVWLECDHMITERCAFSACSCDNSIYVSGGKSIYPTGDPIDSFEVYDANLGYWRILEPLPLKLYHHASVVVNGGVYIFGGKDILDECSDIVMRYDIQTEKWYTIKTTLNNPRFEHSAIAINSEIFLIGGMTQSSYAVTVQIFDTQKNRWRYGRDFPDERKITALTNVKDMIYVCGGVRQFYRRNKPTRTVESKDLYSYDPRQDSWDKVSRMVQYGSSIACTHAHINTKYLTDSEYVSSAGE